MEKKLARMCTAIVLSLNFYVLSQQPQNHSCSAHNNTAEFNQNILDKQEERALQKMAFVEESFKKHFQKSQEKEFENCENANWGFENNDLSNWYTMGCMEIVSGGYDPYSGLPKTYTGDNGNHSLKLGSDDVWGCQSNMISRAIDVPADGQTFVNIHFTVSIFNFPHYQNQAAKFHFNLYDSNSTELECPSYSAYYAYNTGPVGIPSLEETPFPATYYNPGVLGDHTFNSNVSYSDWHHITLDLSAYAGSTVLLVFSNDWCVYFVDWIYNYIDVDCPINISEPILECAQDLPQILCAPTGLDASYDWYYEGQSLNDPAACIDANIEGLYKVAFVPNYLECSDTIYSMEFDVQRNPIADFTVDNVCRGDSLAITNNSQFAENYQWTYAEESYSDVTPELEQQEDHDFIQLVVFRNNCTDTLEESILVFNKPKAFFKTIENCLGIPTEIHNLSSNTGGNTLTCNWDLEGSSFSNDWEPELLLDNIENIVLSLEVINELGCVDTFSKSTFAFPLPIADFKMDNDVLNEGQALVYLTSLSSEDAINWLYNFSDGNSVEEENTYYEFYNAGSQSIEFIVSNEFGCLDTIVKPIMINPDILVYVPNTFTPNLDEHNQSFGPAITGSSFDRNTYEFEIFNRWGQSVYKTEDYNTQWDGNSIYGQSPQGSFTWKLKFYVNNEWKTYVGLVNLIR